MSFKNEIFADTEVRENESTFHNVTGETVGAKRGLHTVPLAAASTLNSTTSILTSGSTFTGTGEQNSLPHVGVVVKTDQPGTLYFEFSVDGINWDSTFPVAGFRVAASISEYHTAVKLGRYFRVRFVNDALGDQTYIRLYTYYGDSFVPSNAPLNQSTGLGSDAMLVRGTNFADEVVRGKRSGVRAFTKFAYRTGLTASSGEQTIWAATGNFTPLTAASTFTITYNAATDGDGDTGARTLYFDYIDADGLYAQSTHTLSTSGTDVTSFSGLGINRVAVASSGASTYNVNDITITATTGGTTQAVIPATQSVTQQAIFFIDSNSTAVGKYIWVNTNKLTGSSPKVVVKGYVYSRVAATRYEIFRYSIDTSAENTTFINEPVGFQLNPTDVLYFVADTDTNNTNINIRFSLVEYKAT